MTVMTPDDAALGKRHRLNMFKVELRLMADDLGLTYRELVCGLYAVSRGAAHKAMAWQEAPEFLEQLFREEKLP